MKLYYFLILNVILSSTSLFAAFPNEAVDNLVDAALKYEGRLQWIKTQGQANYVVLDDNLKCVGCDFSFRFYTSLRDIPLEITKKKA